MGTKTLKCKGLIDAFFHSIIREQQNNKGVVMKIKTQKRYRAFSDGSKTNMFLIRDDGFVLAYDDVAGYYTTCHSLNRIQIGMIKSESRRFGGEK